MRAGADCARREALVHVVAGLGALALAGCGSAPEPVTAEFPLAELPVGGRRLLVVDGQPVEVTRAESGLAARVLLCTHFGCAVAWNAARGSYLCPCHQGVFDAAGRPVAGPPTRPLRTLPVQVEAGNVRFPPPAP
ncbi:MAG: ubiquinol-cytochrome c reductase iron-sulfur subunit [Vicinamibacteria bacterium]|nr:ubiquinol-cytochrome c reductase iron-sulfur subunit [Vicinamibacteria bacterium]